MLWEMRQPVFASLDFPSAPPLSQADGRWGWGGGGGREGEGGAEFREWKSLSQGRALPSQGP